MELARLARSQAFLFFFTSKLRLRGAASAAPSPPYVSQEVSGVVCEFQLFEFLQYATPATAR